MPTKAELEARIAEAEREHAEASESAVEWEREAELLQERVDRFDEDAKRLRGECDGLRETVAIERRLKQEARRALDSVGPDLEELDRLRREVSMPVPELVSVREHLYSSAVEHTLEQLCGQTGITRHKLIQELLMDVEERVRIYGVHAYAQSLKVRMAEARRRAG